MSETIVPAAPGYYLLETDGHDFWRRPVLAWHIEHDFDERRGLSTYVKPVTIDDAACLGYGGLEWAIQAPDGTVAERDGGGYETAAEWRESTRRCREARTEKKEAIGG